jgi:hypothetical protein
MAVTKEFAVKIDTELASWYDKRWQNASKIEQTLDTIKFYEKHYAYQVERIKKYQDELEQLEIERVKIKTEIAKLDLIYRQDPWTRAFLVINSNGHVHSSMDCSTCFPTTRYQWLVQYSNDDEKTIVEDAGQDACTICYPSAPAEVLNRPSRIVTADKIAKAQAKAEREAKKAERIAKEKANAPTANGEALKIIRSIYNDGKISYEWLKTERSAVSYWLNTESWAKISPRKEYEVENQRLIVANLAEKHGVSFEQQLEILNNKLKKRRD